MRLQKTFALSISVSILAACNAWADPVSLGRSIAWIDNKGPNTVGINPGIVIHPAIEFVRPELGTIVTATQGTTTIPVNSLFTGTGLSLLRDFVGSEDFGSGLTGSWQIAATNVLGTPGTAVATTNSLVGVVPLDLPTGLSISGDPLTPTLTWANPTGSFTRNVLEIWDDTHNVLLSRPFCGSGNVCTSFTLPSGLLAPGADYAFRVLAEDNANPDDFYTATRRSNAFVNHTATSVARETGTVLTVQEGLGDTGQEIGAAANNLPEQSIQVGVPGSRGALRLVSGDSLSAAFLHAGRDGGSFGNIVLEDAAVILDGTDIFTSSPPSGGFLNVGRSGAGYVFMSDSATLQLNANGQPAPGINIGRNAGSFGHMVVDGAGTSVTIDGSTFASAVAADKGFIGVGRAGTGRLDILNGAAVNNDPDGVTRIGTSSGGFGGRGTVRVNGAGSLLDAGTVIDLGDPFGNGGLGRLSVEDGGQVLADVLNIHVGGILTGDGGTIGDVLQVVTVNLLGGIVAPGASPGVMNIVGDLVLTEGALLLEAESASLFDQLVISGDLILAGGTIEVILGYTPDPLDVLSFFQVQGTTSIGAGFGGVNLFAPLGSGVPEGTLVNVDVGGTLFQVGAATPTVPVPATLALLAPVAALAGLTLRQRSRRSPTA